MRRFVGARACRSEIARRSAGVRACCSGTVYRSAGINARDVVTFTVRSTARTLDDGSFDTLSYAYRSAVFCARGEEDSTNNSSLDRWCSTTRAALRCFLTQVKVERTRTGWSFTACHNLVAHTGHDTPAGACTGVLISRKFKKSCFSGFGQHVLPLPGQVAKHPAHNPSLFSDLDFRSNIPVLARPSKSATSSQPAATPHEENVAGNLTTAQLSPQA